MNHQVRVLKTAFVTHNVKQFVVEKPRGYSFIPGQATDVSIAKPGLENELRPFTFTCLPNADYLEFIIKIYTGHNGITEKLLDVNEGDHLIIHDVFGAIEYKGPGLFLAGGAGITPFLAILRYLNSRNQLAGNVLLFANRTEEDIILKDELKQMLNKNYFDVLESDSGKRIDKEMIQQHLTADQFYYLCGPPKFTEITIENLVSLGISDSKIVLEQ
ncbi:MAG: flavodoxin reductase [Bacteroidetes bacterium]|nr:flavodoxin reductase [Bacteroidota bacterium]